MRAAVGYLERFAAVRRGRNGVDKLPASGLLVVAFDHRLSRPGDPLLHSHLLVMNRALGPDGRWTALEGQRILDELLTADAVEVDALNDLAHGAMAAAGRSTTPMRSPGTAAKG